MTQHECRMIGIPVGPRRDLQRDTTTSANSDATIKLQIFERSCLRGPSLKDVHPAAAHFVLRSVSSAFVTGSDCWCYRSNSASQQLLCDAPQCTAH